MATLAPSGNDLIMPLKQLKLSGHNLGWLALHLKFSDNEKKMKPIPDLFVPIWSCL